MYNGRSASLGWESLDSNPWWDLTLVDFGQERTSRIQCPPQSCHEEGFNEVGEKSNLNNAPLMKYI